MIKVRREDRKVHKMVMDLYFLVHLDIRLIKVHHMVVSVTMVRTYMLQVLLIEQLQK